MLIEIAKQQLTKAGWYEGRKIDITEQVGFLENLGYEVFDAAKKFMEEYGELEINDKYMFMGKVHIDHHTTCIKNLHYPDPVRGVEKYDIDDKVGQKTIPVVIFSGEVTMYISEDGKMYNNRGLVAYDSSEFWNERYGADAHITLFWNDIAEGKERRNRTKPVRDYL